MITNWTILADGEYRVFAQGWWADVEYRWDRTTDEWGVMLLDSNAYGVVPLRAIALAANEAIGMGVGRHGRQRS